MNTKLSAYEDTAQKAQVKLQRIRKQEFEISSQRETLLKMVIEDWLRARPEIKSLVVVPKKMEKVQRLAFLKNSILERIRGRVIPRNLSFLNAKSSFVINIFLKNKAVYTNVKYELYFIKEEIRYPDQNVLNNSCYELANRLLNSAGRTSGMAGETLDLVPHFYTPDYNDNHADALRRFLSDNFSVEEMYRATQRISTSQLDIFRGYEFKLKPEAGLSTRVFPNWLLKIRNTNFKSLSNTYLGDFKNLTGVLSAPTPDNIVYDEAG